MITVHSLSTDELTRLHRLLHSTQTALHTKSTLLDGDNGYAVKSIEMLSALTNLGLALQILQYKQKPPSDTQPGGFDKGEKDVSRS